MIWGLTVMMSSRGVTEKAGRGFFTVLDPVTQFTVCKQEPPLPPALRREALPFTLNFRKRNLPAEMIWYLFCS